MQKNFEEVITAVSNLVGDDYFNKITLALDKAIDSDYTFIAKINKKEQISETISLVSDNVIIDNFNYELKDTPCNDITNLEHCIYTDNVCNYFPKDQLLIDMGIRGYLGAPALNSEGELIGIIVALYKNKIREEKDVLSLFQLFSGRIGAELERKEYVLKLKKLNNELDLKVKERTGQLEKTIQNLKNTQEQLIESEKMASIGLLVTGIAHEVNTPLGIAITTNSIIEEKIKEIDESLSKKTLSLSQLEGAVNNLKEASILQSKNLNKSKELVNNFKETSVEQYYYSNENINMRNYIENSLEAIKYQLKNINLIIEGGDFEIETLPSLHFQILSNLILNSKVHAFENTKNKKITINIEKKKNKINIIYSDNGKGIQDEISSKIFSPFFTTNRGNGSSGLGLYILYNLVTQKLKGSIKINKSKGFSLTYSFKV